MSIFQDHYDDERDKIVFYITTPYLQDQDQARFFFGLRPVLSQDRRSQTTSLVHSLMNMFADTYRISKLMRDFTLSWEQLSKDVAGAVGSAVAALQ